MSNIIKKIVNPRYPTKLVRIRRKEEIIVRKQYINEKGLIVEVGDIFESGYINTDYYEEKEVFPLDKEGMFPEELTQEERSYIRAKYMEEWEMTPENPHNLENLVWSSEYNKLKTKDSQYSSRKLVCIGPWNPKYHGMSFGLLTEIYDGWQILEEKNDSDDFMFSDIERCVLLTRIKSGSNGIINLKIDDINKNKDHNFEERLVRRIYKNTENNKIIEIGDIYQIPISSNIEQKEEDEDEYKPWYPKEDEPWIEIYNGWNEYNKHNKIYMSVILKTLLC
jgi:hypothetical protein